MGVGINELGDRVNMRLQLKDRELTREMVKVTMEEIVSAMEAGEEVKIQNMGTWLAKFRENNRNPKTGEELGPMFFAKFKFSESVRRRIRAKKTDYFKNSDNE